MKDIAIISIFLLLFVSCGTSKENSKVKSNGNTQAQTENFYAFKAENMQGEEVSMKDYEGKVVLVVNTASKCGFTPQFEGLEKLYEDYKDKGLVVLGFPSNQFGSQDPGTNKEILEFCRLNYGVKFPMFAKIDVNGEHAHPLYTYLKNNVPGTENTAIRWNFTKFLIGKDGKPIKRYDSKVKPSEIEEDIKGML